MCSSTGETDVLIVGAGPTGLVLALWLTRLGVRVRIVDKTAEPGTTSRALGRAGAHARAVPPDRPRGRGRRARTEGRSPRISGWPASKVARAVFGDMGAGLSPFPYALIFPQDEHERLLIERLAEAGVEVERRTELLDFEDAGGRVRAHLKRADGTVETCEAAYIAGCDGAHSTVREALEIGFPGGTYSHLFYVADVEASGAAMNGELHVALDTTDFLAVFPLKGERTRAAHRHRARGGRAPAREPVVERREPARDRVDAHRRRARELVLDLPRAPSRRRSFPQRVARSCSATPRTSTVPWADRA